MKNIKTHRNKTNQISQEGETNKTQINWELIEWKIRLQNIKIEKKNWGFPPVKTDGSPLKIF